AAGMARSAKLRTLRREVIASQVCIERTVPFWLDGREDVVRYRRGLEEVPFVLLIQNLMLNVRACELLNGRARLPEAQRDDLGAAADNRRHRPGTVVPWGVFVPPPASVADVPDVLLSVLSADDAAPDAGNHDSSFRLVVTGSKCVSICRIHSLL